MDTPNHPPSDSQKLDNVFRHPAVGTLSVAGNVLSVIAWIQTASLLFAGMFIACLFFFVLFVILRIISKREASEHPLSLYAPEPPASTEPPRLIEVSNETENHKPRLTEKNKKKKTSNAQYTPSDPVKPTPTIPPKRIEVKVSGGAPPFVSETTYNNEPFKVFLAQVDNPFPHEEIKLKLAVTETAAERAEFPFPDYRKSWPFAWAAEDTLPSAASAKVFKEIVLQSKTDKQKVIFCLPIDGSTEIDSANKGLWCRLIASNEPSDFPLRGEVGFWLWIDENGDLQLK